MLGGSELSVPPAAGFNLFLAHYSTIKSGWLFLLLEPEFSTFPSCVTPLLGIPWPGLFLDAVTDIFDCTDGALLGRVRVGAGPAPVSPLAALAVSPDLSTAVVTNSCHCALALQLNTYFRYSSRGGFWAGLTLSGPQSWPCTHQLFILTSESKNFLLV